MRDTKQQKILRFLEAGHTDDHEIASRVECSLAYVQGIRGGYAHVSSYEKIDPCHMVIGPWTTDRHGNRSREIRGE